MAWWDVPEDNYWSGGNDNWGGWETPAVQFPTNNFDFPTMDYSYLKPSIDPILYPGEGQVPSASFGYGGTFSQPRDLGWSNQGFGAFSQPTQPQQSMGWGSFASNPATIMGLLGALAPLAGTLAGGGKGQSQTPIMSNAQRGGMASASGEMSGFARGKTPLQKQQGGLLDAIASGQGLNQNYAQAVERAFEPQLGALYKQAANAGQARGFYDSPATAPPGGAILGPGLADLQGQIAAQKLALMMGLPGLYTNPVQQQLGAQQGIANMYSNYPRGVQQSAPLGPQIGMGIGGALAGLGGAFAQNQQQNQQNQFQNQWLQYLQKSQDQNAQSQNLYGNNLFQNYQIPDYQLKTNWPEQGY